VLFTAYLSIGFGIGQSVNTSRRFENQIWALYRVGQWFDTLVIRHERKWQVQ
jgi:hypothetical protein